VEGCLADRLRIRRRPDPQAVPVICPSELKHEGTKRTETHEELGEMVTYDRRRPRPGGYREGGDPAAPGASCVFVSFVASCFNPL